MWDQLIFAIIAALVLLYLPGYLASRGLGLSRFLALSLAPVLSVLAYATFPIIFDAVGVTCNLVTMLCPTLVLALLLYGISLLHSRIKKGTRDELVLMRISA